MDNIEISAFLSRYGEYFRENYLLSSFPTIKEIIK